VPGKTVPIKNGWASRYVSRYAIDVLLEVRAVRSAVTVARRRRVKAGVVRSLVRYVELKLGRRLFDRSFTGPYDSPWVPRADPVWAWFETVGPGGARLPGPPVW
jgi:hypothetical protein